MVVIHCTQPRVYCTYRTSSVDIQDIPDAHSSGIFTNNTVSSPQEILEIQEIHGNPAGNQQNPKPRKS
jgi:hypothetical protein